MKLAAKKIKQWMKQAVHDYYLLKHSRTYLIEQGFTKNEVAHHQQFEKRYQELRKKYKRLYFHLICATALGAYAPSLALMKADVRRDKKGFHVYIPLPLTKDNDIFIVNKALLNSFPGYHIVMELTELSFWKYVYGHHKREVKLNHFMDYHPGCHEQVYQKEVPYLSLYHKSIIQFDKTQVDQAEMMLKEMGIDDKYVCLFMRDNAYVSQKTKTIDSLANMRNSSFTTYIDSIESIKNESMKIIRMGQLVEKSIEYTGLVDFASRYYDDFLDLYLFSKCQFYLGDVSGIIALPQLFHRPLALCNCLNTSVSSDVFGPMFDDKDLYLPQLLYHRKEQRYLTLKEQLQFEEDFGVTANKENGYEQRGLIPIQNTAKDILGLTTEMIGRIEGKYIYTTEEEALQSKYHDILMSFVINNGFSYIRGRIGSKFLQENQWYLEA